MDAAHQDIVIRRNLSEASGRVSPAASRAACSRDADGLRRRALANAVARICDLLHARVPPPACSSAGGIDALQLEASGCILASQVPHEMAVAALARLTAL